MTDQHILSLQEVEEISRAALAACGASGSQLEIATRSIVDAECDGIRAVGLNYLPVYCGHLNHNKLRGDAEPHHAQTAPSAIRSDAGNGFAHAAYVEAEQDFYALAESQGLAALTVVNSYSAGVVGWFVDRMAQRGLIGLGFANSPSLVAPAPGASRFFGTNPLAFAVPRQGRPPVVADMATSQVAFVTIKQHAAEGKSIPEGWGYDAAGNISQDPAAVVGGGALAPVGATRAPCWRCWWTYWRAHWQDQTARSMHRLLAIMKGRIPRLASSSWRSLRQLWAATNLPTSLPGDWKPC